MSWCVPIPAGYIPDHLRSDQLPSLSDSTASARVFQPEGFLRPVQAADLAVDPLLGGFINNDFQPANPGRAAARVGGA